MSSEKSNDRAVMEVVDILVRYRWRFVVPAFVVVVLVLAGSLLLPKKYRAQGIFERQQDVVLSEMSNSGATQSYQNASLVQLKAIASEPAVDQLIKDLRPELRRIERYQSAAAIEQLRRDILARVIVRNDLASRELDRLRIEYTAEHPRVAALVVNGLIGNYIADARASMDRKLVETRDFFQREVDRYQAEIEALEDELLRFELENAALLPDNPNSMQAQVQRLELQLEDLRGAREAAELRIASIRRTLDKEPLTIPSVRHAKNPELDRIENEIRALENQKREYVTQYKMKSAHPDMQALDQQIAELREKHAETDREVVIGREETTNPKRAELELRLSEAQSDRETVEHRIEAVQRQIAKADASLPDVLPIRTRARKLEREVDQARRQLSFWEDRLRRVELALTAEDGNRGLKLDFIRPASLNPHPVSPRMSQVLLAAVLLSAVAGSLGVFFTYRSDDSYASGHRLASESRLPLLGTVSELVTRHYRRKRRLRQMTLYPINGALMLAMIVGLGMFVYADLEAPDRLDWLRGQDHPTAAPDTDRTDAGEFEGRRVTPGYEPAAGLDARPDAEPLAAAGGFQPGDAE